LETETSIARVQGSIQDALRCTVTKTLVRNVQIFYKLRYAQSSESTGGTEAFMNHPQTYELYFPPSLKIMLSVMVLVFSSAAAIIVIGAALSPNWAGPPWFVGLFLLAVLGGNALWVLSLPHRIELYQDTIEFISVLRRRRVPAREILSIKPEGTSYGFLVVRTERSKIRLAAQFDGFHDFLTRLKNLNPAVEFRGC
jgi:hypothetical protein